MAVIPARRRFRLRSASIFRDLFLDLIRNRDSALMFGVDSTLDLDTWTLVTNPPPLLVIQGTLEKCPGFAILLQPSSSG